MVSFLEGVSERAVHQPVQHSTSLPVRGMTLDASGSYEYEHACVIVSR